MPSLGSSWATLKISWLINNHSELHDLSPTSNLVYFLFYDEFILTMFIFQNDILIFDRNLHYIHTYILPYLTLLWPYIAPDLKLNIYHATFYN